MTLLLWVLLPVAALAPASIARSKGRDFWLWYAYGVVLWIVAMIHSVALSPDDDPDPANPKVRCPGCARWVPRAATCYHCDASLRIRA